MPETDEMREQIIWPDQADYSGLVWTRTFSWTDRNPAVWRHPIQRAAAS
jgi:hypothetical protein